MPGSNTGNPAWITSPLAANLSCWLPSLRVVQEVLIAASDLMKGRDFLRTSLAFLILHRPDYKKSDNVRLTHKFFMPRSRATRTQLHACHTVTAIPLWCSNKA